MVHNLRLIRRLEPDAHEFQESFSAFWKILPKFGAIEGELFSPQHQRFHGLTRAANALSTHVFAMTRHCGVFWD
jgi:hypothetical protein